MSRRWKIVIAACVLVPLGAAAYFGYSVFYTWRHIREAYAAWDTGTLLVEYMESHDGRWPSSWDDLLSVVRSASADQVKLYGTGTNQEEVALSLAKSVAVDWTFDPSGSSNQSPVTRHDGTKFPVLWQGADPNKMVRRYLADRRATNAPQTR
jgi:hypothetical protein